MIMNLTLALILTASSRKLYNRYTLYSDVIDVWRKQKFRTVATVGRDGALVEAITLNRRVVGSTPALAVT